MTSFETYCNKNNIKNQTIEYNTDLSHNYLGINLQVYDDHGCCFIYPILLTLVFYLKSNKRIDNSIKMLQNGQIDLFVYKCLAEIDPRVNKYIELYSNSKTPDLDVLEDHMDEHLDTCQDQFIKSMMEKVLKFVKQPYWSKV